MKSFLIALFVFASSLETASAQGCNLNQKALLFCLNLPSKPSLQDCADLACSKTGLPQSGDANPSDSDGDWGGPDVVPKTGTRGDKFEAPDFYFQFSPQFQEGPNTGQFR